MAYAIASAALSKLVLVTDCPNANSEDLTETYAERSDSNVSSAIRFFYCHGLAITLLCMGTISACHQHKLFNTMRVSKAYRLANRFAACLVLFLLPLAHNLSSLDLVVISTSMIVWVLLVELWGKSCKDDPFIGEKKGCCTKYSARCTRRQLENAINDNGEVDIVELGREEKTAVDLQN